MDILQAYEKQRPQPIQASPQRQPTDEYGFFIRLVMRLSNGKIQNVKQASYVLLAAAGVILLAAALVFLEASGFFTGTTSLYSTDPLHLPPALKQQPQN